MPRDLLSRITIESHGKLVAYLARRHGGDIAAAEDALADAMVRALEVWSRDGVPDSPESWLLSTARHRMIDDGRRQRRSKTGDDQLLCHLPGQDGTSGGIPDERLQLMFACAHPAIEPSARTALVLQAVLGVTAERIASAFLLSPAAMSQRLVRAKRKIRDSRIRMAIPDQEQFPERLQTVLEAIYASFSASQPVADDAGVDFAAESIQLARLVVELMPEATEGLGLLALLLYIDARRDARRTSDGAYVPLDQQDCDRWIKEQIEEAERLLVTASQKRQTGRFQLEAAIQSAHMQRRFGEPTPWLDIVDLYRALSDLHPTTGIHVARGAALWKAGRVQDALALIDQIPVNEVRQYQPYWAVRAHLLSDVAPSEAFSCFTKAIGLSQDPAVRAYLASRQIDLNSKRAEPLR